MGLVLADELFDSENDLEAVAGQQGGVVEGGEEGVQVGVFLGLGEGVQHFQEGHEVLGLVA